MASTARGLHPGGRTRLAERGRPRWVGPARPRGAAPQPAARLRTARLPPAASPLAPGVPGDAPHARGAVAVRRRRMADGRCLGPSDNGSAAMDVTVSRSYAQHVVVSADAIVRIERRSREEARRASFIALTVGGVIGPLLAALADGIGMPGGPTPLHLRPSDPPHPRDMAHVTTFWAAELPSELSALRGWPQVEGFRPVTVYPRSLIRRVELSLREGLVMSLDREAAPQVALLLPPWDHARVRKALVAAGYPVARERGVLIRSEAPR